MQYTLRNVPKAVDRELRRRAKTLGKSLNEVAIAALRDALGLGEESIRRRQLSDLAGSWQDDPCTEDALRDQRRVDEELWK